MRSPHASADHGLAAFTSAPASTDPAAWHGYIRSAPSFADAQTRIEEAVAASVDFAAMREQDR
jgi:hypothetical protein